MAHVDGNFEFERGKKMQRIQCLWSCSFVFFHVSVRIFSSCLLRLKSHTKKFLADALILQAGSSSVGRHCVAKAELHGLLPHQRRRRRAKRSVNFFKGDLKIRQKGTFLTTTLYVSLPPPFNRLIDKFDVPQLKKQHGDRRIIRSRATTRGGSEWFPGYDSYVWGFKIKKGLN